MGDIVSADRLAIHAGAASFLALLRQIKAQAEGQYSAALGANGGRDIDIDPRDYAVFVTAIENSLSTNVVQASSPHREGYLRAMADLFSLWIDGCTQEIEDMRPLQVTRASFERRGVN